jgi:very-short-patch-repair endonuclease
VRTSTAEYKDIPVKIIAFARRFRQRSTDAETLIWGLLRDRRFGGFKFRRQHPLPPYVADFYCHEPRLCVELDGGQHSDRHEHDIERDAMLEAQDIQTLRFWNNQVFEETESVLTSLWQTLHERHSRSFEKETLTCPPSRTGNEGVPENPNPTVSRYA